MHVVSSEFSSSFVSEQPHVTGQAIVAGANFLFVATVLLQIFLIAFSFFLASERQVLPTALPFDLTLKRYLVQLFSSHGTVTVGSFKVGEVDDVGVLVGLLVGLLVGSEVGDSVGVATETDTGEPVGIMVGDLIGVEVGDVVGDVVRDVVGDMVGDVVGKVVGDVVGSGVSIVPL